MEKRETVAAHEAGHALLAHQWFGEKEVGEINLKAGFTSFPAVDVRLDGDVSRDDALGWYAQMAHGGLAAEEVLLGSPTWDHGTMDLAIMKKQFGRLRESLPKFNHENGSEIASALTSKGRLGAWYSGAVGALSRERFVLEAVAEFLVQSGQDVVPAQEVLDQIKLGLASPPQTVKSRWRGPRA